MRVLYLNPFSQQVSGPDESLLTLLKELVLLGVEAHLVLPRPGPQVPRYEALGVKVHYAPLTVLKRRMSPLELASLGFRLLRGVTAVSRIARRERINLVHTNMEVVLDGAVASRLLRIPHVLHYRGNTLDRPKLIFDLLTRFWTKTAEKVFCISNATAEVFRKRGFAANVEVLYNPVAVQEFASAERSDLVREQLGAGPDDFLVGTVGRIHPRKDIATFVRAGALAAKEIPNLKLAVVGVAEAPEEKAYETETRALASELGIAHRVRWPGLRQDMARVLKALDVFVLCSRTEGFGRVVAEAMASGTPVVVSREGALPELVDHGNAGVLASVAEPNSFAVAVVDLARHRDWGFRLIEAGRRRVAEFDLVGIARRAAAAYRACCSP